MSRHDKAIQEWAKDWMKDNLTDEDKTLIRLANHDLYHGPINDGAFGDPAEEDEEMKAYPGFISACARITKALDDLPSELFIDHTGCVSEDEPEPETCIKCGGAGTDDDDEDCNMCDGQGVVQAFDEYYKVERGDILNVIVGRELAAYV